jgi:Tfp pilus assembly protein PilF
MTRIEKLEAYIEENGKESFLQQALAEEYIKIGNDEQARNILNELLLREPTFISAYIHLCNILVRAGNEEKAIKIYQRGLLEAKRAENATIFNELQEGLEEIIY